MKITPTHLDDFARNAFAGASTHVSANTHYRLEQAALAAVRAPSQLADSSGKHSPRQWTWFGLGIGGGALLASVLMITLWSPLSQTPAPTPVIAEAAAAVSTDPNVWSTDLDEDPSMYAWIASQESLMASR